MASSPAEAHRTLHRNEAAGRYELELDGELVAIATFHDLEQVTVIPHTEVAAALRGHGIGALLVEAVLDDLRARHRTVEPRCWYVAQFIGENPRYADLVAR